MQGNRLTYVKNIILPCVVFSMLAGVFTGGLIFLFEQIAGWVIGWSQTVYGYVRQHPVLLPALIAGAALLGLGAALLLHVEPNCRGGGIPTAIAQLRGLLPFRWLRSVVLVFSSALVTYFCGVPLGTEGPSVQMGAAVGRGAVRIFGRKNPAWDRYIMTGGACAGFAVATGAPLTGILFGFEEAHRRFSPMLFMVSASTVVFGAATSEVLANLFGGGGSLFDFTVDAVLPMEFLWAALVVGLVCGLVAVGFTKLYRLFWDWVRRLGKKMPFAVLTVSVFVIVACAGFFFRDVLGSGHGIVDRLLEGEGVWYLLLITLAVRALLLIFSNTVGVTGGLFVPSLAFGAILGFVCARLLVLCGALEGEYTVVLTTVGMAAFLGASSRIPLTAIAFAMEALCGLSNILPVAAGVTLAYLVIEVVGIAGFNETVIESRVEAQREGKTPETVETDVTVQSGAFVVGKEVRNILWPPSCVVLSVSRSSDRHFGGMSAGDVLRVHYTTYDNRESMELLEHLVGVQPDRPAQ